MNGKRLLAMGLLLILLTTDQGVACAATARTEAAMPEYSISALAGNAVKAQNEPDVETLGYSLSALSEGDADSQNGLETAVQEYSLSVLSDGATDTQSRTKAAAGDSDSNEDSKEDGDVSQDTGSNEGADVGLEEGGDTGQDTGSEEGGDEGQDTGENMDQNTGSDESGDGGSGDGLDEGENAGSKEDGDAGLNTDPGEGEGGSSEGGSDTGSEDGSVSAGDEGSDDGSSPDEGEEPKDEGVTAGDGEAALPDGSETIEGDGITEEVPAQDASVQETELIRMDTLVMEEIPEQIYTGQEICPEAVLRDSQGNVLSAGTHYTINYSNNTAAGQATLMVSGVESGGYTGTLEKSFTIRPCDIGSEEILYGGLDEDYPYTGKKIVPELTLTHGGMTLQERRDYTCSCSSNTEIGTAEVTVKGTGNYTGTVKKNFVITRRSMSSDKIKVVFTDGKSSFTYNGKAWKPEVTVTYDKKKLKKGTDYKISYSNNKNAGTAKVKITGMGVYSGSCTKSFKIKPVNVSKLKISSFKKYSYLGTASIDTTVKFGSVKLKKDKDYTIIFKDGIKNGKNTVTVKGTGNFTGSKKMTVQVTFSSKDKVSLTYCKASKWDEKSKKLTVRVKTGSISKLKKLDSTFYIVQLDSTGKETRKRYKASFSGNYLQAVIKAADGGKAAMMSQYAVAVKMGSKYQILTKTTSFITNPEKTAVMTEPYNGYYETDGKVTSKKGIQGTSEYLEDLGAQHVLLNMDLATLVSTKKKAGYQAYSYNGKTYYFQDMIAWKQTLRYLNGWDEDNPYGWHRRNVTVVLLLSWKSDLSYLIHPSARQKGAAPYYALNMKEKKARETFEALFCYLGEQLGDNRKSRVCNWVLGNEVNCCEAWNYSGGMSLQDCVENYAKAFQLLNQGVLRTASTSRMFISLDHSWSASNDGHSGKQYLDAFAAYMNKTAPKMGWNVDYHPYSQPLSRADFWNDSSNTSGSSGTAYISMNNIKVLTDYLGKIETKYKKEKGSIRVILGEQGFTALKGIKNQERKQAAALGYGYYIAMFNSRIDAYIIRSYLDDPAETKVGLYLGLMSASHEKKQAYDVYKYVDTDQSLAYMNQYLPTVEISSWKKKISNFNGNKLYVGDF